MISFLGLFNVADDVFDLIWKLFREIIYYLATGVYQLIIYFYQIFERLCNSRILDSDALKTITERIGTVLGIVMLFFVIFSVIQLMLEPDKLTDKEKGAKNIVMKIIVVLIMFAFSNFVFQLLYGLQKEIITNQVIGKFILPYELSEEADNNFGGVLSSELFTSFYSVKEELLENMSSDVNLCYYQWVQLKSDIREKRDFSIGTSCLHTVDSATNEKIMTFGFINVILLLGVGIGAVYFIFSYCITVGVRSLQLAFLEIISPMAFVSYLSPKKDTMFQKWLKLYTSTYFDVFIRIAVISLSVFLIGVILDNGTSEFWITVGTENKLMVMAIIIMALLTFAKKAPDLLKELFPNSNASKLGLGVGAPKKLFNDMLFGDKIQKGLLWGAKTATAGTAIGLTGLALSGISRFRENKKLGETTGSALKAAAFGGIQALGRGLSYGGKNGFKDMKKVLNEQREKDNKYNEMRRKGGTLRGAYKAKAMDFFGDSPATAGNEIIGNMADVANCMDNVKKAADEMFFVKSAKDTWEKAVQWNGESKEAFEARKESYRVAYKNLQKAAINYVLTGDDTNLKYKVPVEKTITRIDEKGNSVVEKVLDYENGEEKNYATAIKDDHASNLAFHKIELQYQEARNIVEHRKVEFYDEKGTKRLLDFNEETNNDLLAELNLKNNADLFMKLGDFSENTGFYVNRNEKMDVKNAEAEYIGVKNNNNKKN